MKLSKVKRYAVQRTGGMRSWGCSALAELSRTYRIWPSDIVDKWEDYRRPTQWVILGNGRGVPEYTPFVLYAKHYDWAI